MYDMPDEEAFQKAQKKVSKKAAPAAKGKGKAKKNK